MILKLKIVKMLKWSRTSRREGYGLGIEYITYRKLGIG